MILKECCRTCKYACITPSYCVCVYAKSTDLDGSCELYKPIDEECIVDIQEYKDRIRELEYRLAQYEERDMLDLWLDV